MTMTIKKTVIVVAVLVSTLGATAASAAILVDIPDIGCPLGGPCPTATQARGDIAASIVRIYQFAVAIAGVLAVGTIVAGSIYISASAGSADKQSEGKDMITSAIWGLVLLFGSYLILNTLNPRLIALETPANTEPCMYDTEGQITNEPCNPSAPEAYSYKEELIPGETQAAALSPEEIAKAQQNRPAEVAYCTTLDPAPPPEQLKACLIRSNCFGCTPLDGQLTRYMKPDQCRWGGEPSNCLVNPKANAALLQLAPKLTSEGVAFRITEAFPPTVTHLEDSHYNGCAVDITVWSMGTKNQCEAVAAAIKAAESSGFNKFGAGSANEYTECGGKKYKTTTGGHLHLSTAGCP